MPTHTDNRRCAIVAGTTQAAAPAGGPSFGDHYVALLTKLELSELEANSLTDEGLVLRLVDAGVSRLTGERIVALGRGSIDPGRARPHGQSRPWATPRSSHAG